MGMSGKSYIVRISKGTARESEKINENLRLLSLNWLRRTKLIKLKTESGSINSNDIILSY